ncbi:hypothetical protein O4215_01460 [Rhodococcus maanshanensis]|uniref:hypothetical protein n=1 Tax=Rhodococcus maanshanensis TaxID=183556 RepID=UPI0022B4D8A8|nr:hypothetical protein [Rhodococcus maanshanensis]MCZ4554228.1 hypothetical protein [Rhodococcus maanshanensis]
MRTIRAVVVSVAVAASLTGGTAAASTGSSSDPVGISPTYTLGGGAIGCVGTVDAHYDPNALFFGQNPTIWVRPEFTFVPSLFQAPYCGVEATLRWKNLDTGASGVFPGPPVPLGDNTPLSPTDGPWVPMTAATGVGRIEVQIDTNFPHVQGRGTIVVP